MGWRDKGISGGTACEGSGASIDAFFFEVGKYFVDRLCLGYEGDDLHLGSTPGADELYFEDEAQEFGPFFPPVFGRACFRFFRHTLSVAMISFSLSP